MNVSTDTCLPTGRSANTQDYFYKHIHRPPELPIWPHSEYGWSTINPAWLTFSALETPSAGGETPIISSLGMAAALRQRAPDFVDRLRRKGVRYLYRYGAEDIVSTTGASVLSAYGRDVLPGDDAETMRAKIEQQVRRHSDDFVWHNDGSLSVTHVVPSECAPCPPPLPSILALVS